MVQKKINKLLYVSQKPALPIIDGGTQAIYSLLSQVVSFGEDIHYAPLSTLKHPYRHQLFEAWDQNMKITELEVEANNHVLGLLFNWNQSIPYNCKRYQSDKIEQTLIKLDESEHFNTVICDGFYALCALPESWFGVKKIVYRAHNVEHAIWLQKAHYSIGIKKLIFKRLASQMHKFECQLIRLCDEILCLSERDAQFIKNENPKVEVLVPPILPYEKEEAPYPLELSFIGNFEWEPNEDAIKHFIRYVFPKIKEDFPELTLHLAGKKSENFHAPSSGVIGHGFVEDSKLFIWSHGIFICPLRYGSGVNMKLLEAISVGQDMVISKQAAEGLPLGHGLTVAQDDQEFVRHVVCALKDKALRQKQREVAKSTLIGMNQSRSQNQSLKDLIYG